MKTARSFTLLETLLALALLAGIGAALLGALTNAMRQVQRSAERAVVLEHVEPLLWSWREAGTPVTLPSTGQLTETLRWHRSVAPQRLVTGLIPTQVTLRIFREANPHTQPILELHWVVPDPPSDRTAQRKER